MKLKPNMKSLRQHFIIGLTIVLGLTSCRVEKRLHMSGYHITWNNHRQHSDDSALARNKTTAQNQILIEEKSYITNSGDYCLDPTIHDEKITASVHNEQNILSQEEKINSRHSHKSSLRVEEKHTTPTFKSEFAKGSKMILANADEPRSNGLAIAGFVCSIVGFFVFGILLGVLAIIFSAVGLGKINKDPSKWKGKGLAIAGLIIGIVDIVGWIIIIALLL